MLLLLLLLLLLSLLFLLAQVVVAVVPGQAGHEDDIVGDDLAVGMAQAHQQVADVGIVQLDQLLFPVSTEVDEVDDDGDGDDGDDDDGERAQEQHLDCVRRQARQVPGQKIALWLLP